MRLLSLSSIARVQKRSWECALDFWRIAKRIQKVSVFCWKCTILARCLNRVGCEFWDLSRTHEGHVTAVKCRRIFDLSSGTPWISNLSFCPSWPVCHLREHLYMCSMTPHTHSHVFATYLSSHPLLTSLMFSPSSSLFATMVCVPPSPSVVRLATLLSFWPRAKVTPQLWSCCWERGLTRTPRIG